MELRKKHILHLPKWYTSKYDPMYGLFVKKHVEICSSIAKTSVIYVQEIEDLQTNVEFEFEEFENLRIYRCFFRSPKPNVFAPVSRLWTFIKYQYKLYKRLKKELGKPDLIHVHILTRNALLPLLLKKLKGIPFIITEHWSRYLSYNPTFKGLLRKKLTRLVVRNAELLSTVSKVLMKGMNNHGLKNNNQIILPNLVDINKFKLTTRRQNEIPQLISVSCFEDKSKNLTGFIRVIKRLINEGLSFNTHFIGNGEDFDMIKAYAKELGIPDTSVSFHGVIPHEKVVTHIQNSDLMVQFSNYETFGITVAESLACGTPVIASDAGALPEVLPLNYGVLVKAGDEDALYIELKKHILSPPNYPTEEMHNHIKENYSVHRLKLSLSNTYHMALQ
jgi:glycosyltransferase involved in cell wall biosynthesis